MLVNFLSKLQTGSTLRSNARETAKSEGDLRTTPTRGGMQVYPGAVKSLNLRDNDFIAGVEIEDAETLGLPVFGPNKKSAYIVYKGFARDEKENDTVGRKLAINNDTRNGNFSATVMWEDLGGSTETAQHYQCPEDAYVGIGVNADSTTVLLTQDSPEDPYEQVIILAKTQDGMDIEWTAVNSVVEAKTSAVPFLTLEFMKASAKKASLRGKKNANGTNSTEIDTDDDDNTDNGNDGIDTEDDLSNDFAEA